jgi:WD40 repeat protein
VHYNPNSLILAVASSDRGIRFYDTTTGTQLMEIPIHANAVAFSPNGEFLAVSISWEVHIYRLSDILDSAQQ